MQNLFLRIFENHLEGRSNHIVANSTNLISKRSPIGEPIGARGLLQREPIPQSIFGMVRRTE